MIRRALKFIGRALLYLGGVVGLSALGAMAGATIYVVYLLATAPAVP